MSDLLPPPDVRLMNFTSAALIVVLAAMALVLLVNWGMRHPAFALKAIRVEGDVAHNNAVTLRANVAPRLAGNFFTVDLHAARTAFEAMPWVRHAVVRREFPNRLRVVLEEHRVSAHWGPEAESRLLNSHGEIFEANSADTESEDLPRLTGPDAQAREVLAAWQTLAPRFTPHGAVLVELELTGRGVWRARLDNSALIELGRGDLPELGERLDRFLATLPQVAARYGRRGLEHLESADLRHGNGYALRLQGVTTVGADATDTRK